MTEYRKKRKVKQGIPHLGQGGHRAMNSLNGAAIPYEMQTALELAVLHSLREAHAVHESLGASGEAVVRLNQWGDMALQCDISAEAAVIKFLRDDVALPIRMVSEEHGTLDLHPKPKFLGVLDGLDGSSVYKRSRGKGRYGTMFAIFANLDPAYEDYVACGIMEHSTGRLFIAAKRKGAWLYENGKGPAFLRTSLTKTLDASTRIYTDDHFDIVRATFTKKLSAGGFSTTYLGSSAVYYADVASAAADLALECTRKGNLEMAVAYGLICEASGVMVDLEGNDLGPKKYLQWGQKEKIPVITAATIELAKALRLLLAK